MAKEWHNRHWARLRAEQIIMNGKFPQFVLKKAGGYLVWEGILVTNFGTEYRVSITYPKNYPYAHPVFRVLRPKIKNGCPHRYLDGSLCVYPERWNHERCTAPAGVPLIAAWLAMYELWLRTGKRW